MSDKDAPPALWEHVENVFAGMAKQSSPHEDNPELLVYEGFLTHLITGDLGLSVPYYTHVMKALKGMDCVRQLRRGGGSSPSRWLLVQRPTLELFETYQETEDAIGGANRTSKVDMLEQRMRDMNQRINELEEERA